MTSFDDPFWRSYLTHSTKSQILVMRQKFRDTVAYVTGVMRERYRIAALLRRIELEEIAGLERLEQEERDNADPIRH